MENNWISIKDRLPKYDPKHQKAYDILIRANNERYYVGYPVTEYNKTVFHQSNGRKILDVTHWMLLPKLSKQ